MRRLLFILMTLSLGFSAWSGCALFEEAEQTTPPDAGSSDGGTDTDAGESNDSGVDAGGMADAADGGDPSDMGPQPGCGDGVLEPSTETCDDGNLRSHDGCSSGCTEETLAWTEIEPDFRRSRYTTAIAYDPNSDRIIGFGGQVDRDSAPNATTFEINGGDWFEISPQTSPPALQDHAMAYSETAGGIVLFGGALSNGRISDETWLFDGTDWQRLRTATTPPARDSHALTTFGDQIAIFGGNGESGKLNDLWTFDGSDWTERAGAVSGPSPRSEHSMSSIERETPYLVLHGGLGEGSSSVLADTWLWGETDGWDQITSSDGPGRIARHGMTGSGDTAYLFGGYRRNDDISSELWRFDSGGWVEVEIASNWPGFRQEPAVVHTADGLVLYGGYVSAVPFGDIWEYREAPTSGWTQLAGGEWPAGREDFGFAWDPDRGHLALFGGQSIRASVSYGDTWIWSPANGWTEIINAGFPRREDFVAEYLPPRNSVLMHGGVVDRGTAAEESDTWLFDGTGWTMIEPGTFDVALQDAATAWDPDRETLFMYGGERANGYSSDIYSWVDSGSGGSWAEVEVGAIRPDRRTSPDMVADPYSGSLIIFGGFNGNGLLQELLAFDGASWSSSATSPLPQARADFGFAAHGYTGELVIHGGSTQGGDLDDVWLSREGFWSPLAFANQPVARSGHGLVWADSVGGMLLFGGYRFGGGTTAQYDFWRLRYESEWPEEVCDDSGVDDDQDGLADCDDPDCFATCED